MDRGDKIIIIDKSPLACCDGKEGTVRCKNPDGGIVVFTDHLCPETYYSGGMPQKSNIRRIIYEFQKDIIEV